MVPHVLSNFAEIQVKICLRLKKYICIYISVRSPYVWLYHYAKSDLNIVEGSGKMNFFARLQRYAIIIEQFLKR